MSLPSRIAALLAYLVPVIGWLYLYLFERKNSFALFHLRQAVGLCLFLAGALVAWVVVGWLLAWIPYMVTVSAALFTLVITAYLFGAVAWLMGIVKALRNQATPLPLFGRWADRLPIK